MELAEVRWVDLPHFADDGGGILTAIEATEDIPFEILRVFYMYATPSGVERGGHAHRDTQQVIVPIHGSFSIDLSDGTHHWTFHASDPNRGIYMPAMIWIRLYDFSPAAVCLVLADTHYDACRSVRTWDEFLRARKDPIRER